MVKAAGPVQRARALLELRRPADAERELRGLLAEEPEHAVGHALLALALAEQRRPGEAVAEAHEAVRLAPDSWFPHYVAGQVHNRARQPDQAIAAGRAALALSPEWPPIWELLARAHVLKGEWPLVAGAAERGLALDPESADLMSLLSLAQTALGQTRAATETAGRAVGLAPESATAHLVYGRAALASGDARVAADAFREVLRLDPGYGQARDLLVTALKERNPLHRWLSRVRRRFLGGWWLVFLLPALPPVIAVFVLIALLHWAAWVTEAVTVLRLARAKATGLLFDGGESRVALACCGLLVAGAATLVAGVVLGSDVLGTAGAAVMALVTAVQEAAHTGSPRGRAVLYGWAALLGLAAVASLVSGVWPIALLTVYAALATIWVAAGVRRVFGPLGDARTY
ncbi:tetratricopeptide repeat protein [Nonomuraea sp. NPDC003214]